MLKMLNQVAFPGYIRLSLSIIHIRKRDKANHHISIVKFQHTFFKQGRTETDQRLAAFVHALLNNDSKL